MENYSFEDLSEDLKIGREIEFEYKNRKYSITNSIDGYWYLYCDTTKTELMKICKFEEKLELVKKVAEFKINEISIKEIFNTFEYNKKSLYIF